jgi:hypothetical protein
MSEARARAAFLETEMIVVAAQIEQTLKAKLEHQDFKAVYHAAFKSALDRYIANQAMTPMFADAHAGGNLIYARLFTLLASSAKPLKANANLRDELLDKGLSAGEADAMIAILDEHGDHPLVSANYVADYIRGAGVQSNEYNKKAVARVIAVAYRNACLEASNAMGRPIDPAEIWAVPGGLDHMLGLACQAPTAATIAPLPPTQSDPTLVAPTIVNDGRIDLRITELAARAITHNISSKEWRKDRARDVNAAVNLFVGANGDLLASQIQQTHISAMTALFPKLPTRYGHTKEDRDGGLSATLERGEKLSRKWKDDPIKAEKEKLPTMGFSIVTHNKHLHWISALIKFADGHGIVIPNCVPSKARLKKKKRKGSTRPPWVIEDLRHLFTAPIWTGGADLWRRFDRGSEIFHDGAYFGLLLVTTTLGRSDEPNGLMLDDVFDDADVPYVWYRNNAYRLIKNDQSDRKIPIGPSLIRLGFLDYARNMRALGHDLVFPEFLNPSGFDHVFYDKVFEPLRAWGFPNGSAAMRGRKDADVHSIRGRGLSVLRDKGFDPGLRQYLAGHVPDGETAASYEEDPDMKTLLPLVTALDEVLLPEIMPHPLNLRPAEWQKFGAPNGRRKSSNF